MKLEPEKKETDCGVDEDSQLNDMIVLDTTLNCLHCRNTI